MEINENKETSAKATIDAVKGLVQAVPIYQDAVQPAAKQIGKSLETVSKTVNIALAPIKALVWGYEKIEEFISTRVSEKLKNVPEENIVTPPPQVAGPAVEALRYAGHDENLRELYANLLANAMDRRTLHQAHPSFVEILKNLSSDEAVLLQIFVKKEQYPLINVKSKIPNARGYNVVFSNHSHLHKEVQLQQEDLLLSYIDNLCRLGILEIPPMTYLTTEAVYEPLENDTLISSLKIALERSKMLLSIDRKLIRPTEYGRQFISSVVAEKI